MGNGSVTPVDADPQVQAFIDMAMQQAKEGNYQGAKDHFMKAKEKTTQANIKEFVEGALERLSLRVESGKLNPPVEKIRRENGRVHRQVQRSERKIGKQSFPRSKWNVEHAA